MTEHKSVGRPDYAGLPKSSGSYTRLIELVVNLDKVLPLPWEVIDREDRVRRTLRLAESTIDALVCVDEKLIVNNTVDFHGAFVDTFHRANCRTPLILHANTWRCNYVCHCKYLPVDSLAIINLPSIIIAEQ